MIYIMPASTYTSSNTGCVEIRNTQFINNRNTHFIEVNGEKGIVPWEISMYIYLYSINISLNKHFDGYSLISITNGMLYLEKNSTIIKNGYYENILMLQLSTVIFSEYNTITDNHVTHIMKSISSSYFIMNVGSTLSIINNTVYNIVKQMYTYEDNTQPVCPIQFYSPKYNYDYHLHDLNVHILMLNNIYTIPKGLTGSDLTFGKCAWLARSAFRRIDAALVFKMVLQIDYSCKQKFK